MLYLFFRLSDFRIAPLTLRSHALKKSITWPWMVSI